MIEILPDLFFALEALVERDVALELHVRDLERDGLARRAVEGLPKIDAIPLRASSSCRSYWSRRSPALMLTHLGGSVMYHPWAPNEKTRGPPERPAR